KDLRTPQYPGGPMGVLRSVVTTAVGTSRRRDARHRPSINPCVANPRILNGCALLLHRRYTSVQPLARQVSRASVLACIHGSAISGNLQPIFQRPGSANVLRFGQEQTMDSKQSLENFRDLDLVCDKFERGWRHGTSQPVLERYLAKAPQS